MSASVIKVKAENPLDLKKVSNSNITVENNGTIINLTEDEKALLYDMNSNLPILEKLSVKEWNEPIAYMFDKNHTDRMSFIVSAIDFLRDRKDAFEILDQIKEDLWKITNE